MLLLLSQPWGVLRCAPRNIVCTGIWKVLALWGIKVCTGEHCVHWNLKSPSPLRYQGVDRGTLHALDDNNQVGPHPTNSETQSQSQSQSQFWTWNQIQIHPQGPQPSPRVPTLTLPPRVPTLPTLKLNSIRKLKLKNSNSNFKLNPKLTF